MLLPNNGQSEIIYLGENAVVWIDQKGPNKVQQRFPGNQRRRVWSVPSGSMSALHYSREAVILSASFGIAYFPKLACLPRFCEGSKKSIRI
jgi:hypothetical protein